jgi:hypothetical protein
MKVPYSFSIYPKKKKITKGPHKSLAAEAWLIH